MRAAGLALLLALTGCGSSADPGAGPEAAVWRLEAEGCSRSHRLEATGVAVAGDVVATVAHTFDDVGAFELIDVDGRIRSARIVWLDPLRDLALLQLDEGVVTWLPLGGSENGDVVDVITAASAEALEIKSATVLSHVTATLDGEGERAAIEIAADIGSGDSGAPLINAANETVGIVFATVRDDNRGWAIAASEIEAALARLPSDAVPLSC